MSNYLKVMVSPYYNGGSWTDEKTQYTFDTSDAGKVVSFPRQLDLSGILNSVRKNHLLLVEGTQDEFSTPLDTPLTAPVILEVRGKMNLLEISFDRPVFPAVGRKIVVPTKHGEVTLHAEDAYMEAYTKAAFAVNANGKVKIEEGAFVDEAGIPTEAYGFEEAPKAPAEPEPTPEPEQEEAPEVEEEVKVESKSAPKKASRKRNTKKTEE